jgi:hypothetical protein
MHPDELIARERIRDAIARYAHFADGGRLEELAALFAEDGTLEIAGRPPLTGRAAIVTFLNGVKRTPDAGASPFIRHHVSSVRIDVQGANEATAASYFFVITERGPDHWGRYRDDFIRIDEEWLFKRRRVRVDGKAMSGARSDRAR